MKHLVYRRRVLFNRDALSAPATAAEPTASAGQFTQPADGWFQLAPLGEHSHAESGLIQVLDEAALRSIVRRFEADSQRPNFAGLLVDFDHFSYDVGKSSAAAGWITRLEARADGLWAQVRWTRPGEHALAGGAYRFLSPVWLRGDTEEIGGGRIRPLRLDSAGLTNTPNLKGLTPLSNRRLETAVNRNPQTTPMHNIARTLELAADTSEEVLCAEIEKLKQRAVAAEAAVQEAAATAGPLRNRVAEMERQIHTLTESVAEADLNRYAPRFKPEAREKWKAQLLANRATALELLESLPEPASRAPDGSSLLNRAHAKAPAGEKDFPALVEEYATQHKCAKSQAIDAVLANHRQAHETWLRNGGGLV